MESPPVVICPGAGINTASCEQADHPFGSTRVERTLERPDGFFRGFSNWIACPVRPSYCRCHVSSCRYWFPGGRGIFSALSRSLKLLPSSLLFLIVTCRRLAYISQPAYIRGGSPRRVRVGRVGRFGTARRSAE